MRSRGWSGLRAVFWFGGLGMWFAVPAQSAGPQITIYARDLAYVRESRTLDAADTVVIGDLPERLDFTSVRLQPEGGLKVRRLAYRYDLASGDGLLEEARGSRVRVVHARPLNEGTLLELDGRGSPCGPNDGWSHTGTRDVEDVRSRCGAHCYSAAWRLYRRQPARPIPATLDILPGGCPEPRHAGANDEVRDRSAVVTSTITAAATKRRRSQARRREPRRVAPTDAHARAKRCK